ncbi:MAG: serpin family protein [Verrucomicrobiota bacterium]|jgi:serpin B
MSSSKTNLCRILSGVLICAIGLLASAALASDLEKLADANTGFAFDLLKQIAKEQPKANIFISPFSVSTVLQMLDNGAAGTTKQEMERVLHTSNLSLNSLNAACKDLNKSLNSQTNIILELADAIWYQKEIPLKPDFVSRNKKFYGAELEGVNFDSPQSAKTINDWADKSTHGRVKDVVSFPFPPATQEVLANAIYFKGKWMDPFDKKATKPQAFHLADGSGKKVPMMRKSGHFSYQQGDGFQAVRMPYAGGRLEMVLFLPATNSSPAKLLAGLNNETWQNKIMPLFGERPGTVALPRFKIEYNISLNDSLKALGMKGAFTPSANFSSMVDGELWVSDVRQKSYVDVNEEGTEAAAVTTVVMVNSVMLRPATPFEMIVDRPFVFVIEDNQTQSILFMGVVCDPAGQGAN